MTQADLPPHVTGKVELAADEPAEMIGRLAQRGWRRAYVDGGRLVQAFLRAGLISDMAIFHMPILLGAGRPLFGPLAEDIRLETVSAAVLPSGAVRTDYRVRALPR